MLQLPKGYYAVQCLPNDVPELVADSFTYKGVTYAAEVGVNLFPTVASALAAAKEVPDTVLQGLDYEAFEAPVILLSAGSHSIGRKGPKDRLIFDRSVIILGQQAGVSPNLPSTNPLEPPALNPARDGGETTESVLCGGYDFGCAYTTSPTISVLTIDGVCTAKSWRFGEWRSEPACDIKVTFRNILHKSPAGFTMYSLSCFREDSPYKRDFLAENIRLDKDFFDCGYGGILFYLNAWRSTIRNLCVDGTTQLFGFTSIPRIDSNCAVNTDETNIILENCYIRNLRGENGIATQSHNAGERAVNLTIKDSTLVNASRPNEAPLQPYLANEKSYLRLVNCRVIDTRGNTAPAVEIHGPGHSVVLENTVLEGFSAECGPAYVPPTKAPAKIENRAENWQTDTADPHCVIAADKADYTAMDAYYEGCRAYYGDQHVHTNCGGTSDGHYPMKDWVAKMDELGLDFAIVVDHRQMRGYFLPEWSEERFVMGTEPGTSITDLADTEAATSTMHYNMVFPHKYALAMVLANFPEFKFKGDELTGKFGYPQFTLARIRELNDYLRSIGGMLVHAHPKTLMASSQPLDYYMGERSYLETIVGRYPSHASYKSYDLWVEILATGKHMLASGGSDTHGNVTNSCPSTFYTKRRFHTDFVGRMYAGDYAVGGVGVKMMIDGHPMGSQITYKEGMKLTVRLADFMQATWRPDTAYELQIITDKGVAYASMFDGKEPQAISLAVQKRNFYRLVVNDLTHGYRVSVSNPIWLDKEEAAEPVEQA